MTGRSVLAPPAPFILDRPPTPTFSIVIPAYEAAEFIADAIESALTQTVRPHEVIVSDDGSTDELDEALEPYRPHLVVVRGDHLGPAAARNRALNRASGEFFAVLDADDSYHPERLEALQQLAVERPDLDILGTDAALQVAGETVGRFSEATPFPVDDQRTAVFRACFLCAPAVRRTRLLAIGGYDEWFRVGEDWDAMLRLIFAGCQAGLVDEPLYSYRLRAGSVTAKRLPALESRVQLLEKARGHPGLSPAEARALELSLRSTRLRLLKAQVEAAILTGDPGRRRCALQLALANGVQLRERGRALRWAIRPTRARLELLNSVRHSSPTWERFRT